MHHTRGTWEPTVISQVTRDFCAVFYHQDQYWYKYWFKNAANLEEIKENCLATKDVGINIFVSSFCPKIDLYFRLWWYSTRYAFAIK